MGVYTVGLGLKPEVGSERVVGDPRTLCRNETEMSLSLHYPQQHSASRFSIHRTRLKQFSVIKVRPWLNFDQSYGKVDRAHGFLNVEIG